MSKQHLFYFLKQVPYFFKIPSKKQQFKAICNEIYIENTNIDYDKFSLPQQIKIYHKNIEKLKENSEVLLLLELYSSLLIESLSILGKKWRDTSSLPKHLLDSNKKPQQQIESIAKELSICDSKILEWVLEAKPDHIYENLQKTSPYLFKKIDYYLTNCLPLKLESEASTIDVIHLALETLHKGIKNESSKKTTRLKGWKGCLYHKILTKAESITEEKHQIEQEYNRIAHIFRRLFSAMGRNLKDLDLIEDDASIYFLTIDELSAFIEGNCCTLNLRALVEVRKKEHAKHNNQPSKSQFLTVGTPSVSFPYPAIL